MYLPRAGDEMVKPIIKRADNDYSDDNAGTANDEKSADNVNISDIADNAKNDENAAFSYPLPEKNMTAD